ILQRSFCEQSRCFATWLRSTRPCWFIATQGRAVRQRWFASFSCRRKATASRMRCDASHVRDESPSLPAFRRRWILDETVIEQGAAPNRHLRLGICLGVFGFHKSGRGGRYWSLGDITRMRRFGLATLFGIALLNFFLAYSGHYLSSQVRQFIADHHTKPSSFSLIALAIPPWFYFIAAVAAVAAILGLTRRQPPL